MAYRFPTLDLDIAFATTPNESPAWTPIGPLLRSGTIRRGRQHELDTIEAGEATFVVDNADRSLDPTNAASPYYPNVVPTRRMRLRANWPGAPTYAVFTGYVDQYPQAWPGMVDAIVTLKCFDGLAILAAKKLNATWPADRADTRINRILDAVSWTTGQNWVLDSTINSVLDSTTVLGPAGDRAVDTGYAVVPAATLANDDALSHALDVTFAEQGLFFVGADGAVVFHSHDWFYVGGGATSKATFGDGGGAELPYSDIVLSYDREQIRNEIRLVRDGGAEQVVSDLASQIAHFPITYNPGTVLLTRDDVVHDLATYMLRRYKDPHMRVSSITIRPQRDPDRLWPQVLGRELGDRITVVRRPPGGGSPISGDYHIEAIEHEFDTVSWRTTWTLSPVDPDAYWVLDTSALDSTARLAY
jgi:hypothetical protein